MTNPREQIECCFVDVNGTVMRRLLDRALVECGTYRVARHEPVSVLASVHAPCPDVRYDEYIRQGDTLDGVPIFCAPGFKVETACTINTTPVELIERADEFIRKACRQLVDEKYGNALDVGERYGDDWLMPEWEREDLRRQGLTRRRAILRVVVKS